MTIDGYMHELHKNILRIDTEVWEQAGDILLSAYQNDNNVWIAGNGGNFANTLHFATDWSKGLFTSTGKALRARAIGENGALSSAFSNDLGFENQIEKYLSMFAQVDDVVVLMTAGGTSRNIINAAALSKARGLKVIGITGGKGLDIKLMFDVHVHIQSFNIQVVEDIHSIFGHAIFKYLESKIL
jgi:D-sedoheptulose 7-phosphate isomerase